MKPGKDFSTEVTKPEAELTPEMIQRLVINLPWIILLMCGMESLNSHQYILLSLNDQHCTCAKCSTLLSVSVHGCLFYPYEMVSLQTARVSLGNPHVIAARPLH